VTRINVVDVQDLTDSWLLAEFREITRLPDTYEKSLKAKNKTQVPSSYTLGKGHVVFFHDKGEWLESRYNALYRELLSRGYNATLLPIQFSKIPTCVSFSPSSAECLKNITRFREKFEAGQKHKLNKSSVDPKVYLQFLVDKYMKKDVDFHGIR
jgi:deoxyribonuclease (pyrimidine dimer)